MNFLIGIVLIGTCVIADEDEFRRTSSEVSSEDPEALYESLQLNQKDKLGLFLKTFKKTPSNKKWDPKTKLCFDVQFPWVMLPCEMIPKSFTRHKPSPKPTHSKEDSSKMESTEIKSNLEVTTAGHDKEFRVPVIHEAFDVKTVDNDTVTVKPEEPKNDTEIAQRIFFSLFHPKVEKSKTQFEETAPETKWVQTETNVEPKPNYWYTPNQPDSNHHESLNPPYIYNPKQEQKEIPNTKPFEALLSVFPKACLKEKDTTYCQFKDYELNILNGVTKITKKIYVIKKRK